MDKIWTKAGRGLFSSVCVALLASGVAAQDWRAEQWARPKGDEMAVNKFLHVNNDWNNVSNWSTNVAPTGLGADRVYIPAGSQSITVNMDQTAVDLISMDVERGYTGSIGGSGAPLRITCGTLTIRSEGTIFYNDENDGGPNTAHTDAVIVDSPNALLAAEFTGTQIEHLVIKNGAVTQTDMNMTTAHVQPSAAHDASTSFIHAGNGSATDFYIDGGVVTFNIGGGGTLALQHVTMNGGLVTIDTGGSAIAFGVAVVEINGGHLVYKSPEAGVVNTFEDLYVRGGFVDFTQGFENMPSILGDFVFLAPGQIKRPTGTTFTVSGVTIEHGGVYVTD